jgi:thioredoxin 1
MGKNAHVTEVNDSTFEAEVLRADRPVLVEFGAAWCPPCRALAPIVERVAADCAGTLKVVMVDADESPEAAKRCGVRAVPTLVVFRGGEKRGQHVGLTTREKVVELVGSTETHSGQR